MTPRELAAKKNKLQWSRRDILAGLASGGALTATFPTTAHAAEILRPALKNNQGYWETIRSQFPIKPDYIMMNAANLCPTHKSVTEFFQSLTNDREGDLSFHNRGKFRKTKERSRYLVADYLAVESTEIALTRNTSEGNNTVITGLHLGPGDEVVIWDQNHPSASLAWKTRAKREGFTVKEVTTPMHPSDPEELMSAFTSQFTKRTRVFSASHVSNTSGVGLPIKELCRYCRQQDILSHIDGAQTFGALSLDLHELGCDFFTGSLHKWPMGPKETGILYVKMGLAEQVWPSIVTVGYDKIDPMSAAKFDNLGQLDDAKVAAIAPAIEFCNQIGARTVETRLRVITDRLKQGVRDIPGSVLLTPEEHAMSAGVVIFSLPGIAGRSAFEKLYKEHRIAAAPAGIIDGIRLSPHVYNTDSEIDRAVEALKNISA